MLFRSVYLAAETLGMDRPALDQFLAGPHCSSGLYPSLDEAPVRWLVKLLEGLKAMGRRRAVAQHQHGPAAPAASAHGSTS